MSSEFVLSVEGLSKSYRTYENPRQRLAELLGLRAVPNRIYAVEDVSLQLGRGEILGLIGPNGAGKSTLLQMIAGTIKPSSGRVHVDGKVTALLELGAGVDTELTGYENIFLMGATYGLDNETIKARLDAIASFSELGVALRNPVKTYSSGMFLRLAFSVSTALEPDLLIVDEALSVGDVGFQGRCLDRLEQLIEQGSSILLASHDLQLIKNYCTSAICLDKGRIVASGEPELVTEQYYYLMRTRSQRSGDAMEWHADGERAEVRFQTRRASIEAVEIERSNAGFVTRSGEVITVRVEGQMSLEVGCPAVAVMLRDARGYNLYGLIAQASKGEFNQGQDGRFLCRFELPMNVASGQYSLTVRLEDRRSDTVVSLLDKRVGVCRLTVEADERAFLGTVNLFGRVHAVCD